MADAAAGIVPAAASDFVRHLFATLAAIACTA